VFLKLNYQKNKKMSKTILLIEDNKEMRENISEILELSRYEVISAKNGKEGVEFAQENKPNLIVCDIMMPILDGYGVLHMLSKNEATADIPFIFLTAKAEKTDFRKGMEMGADDYITKPFDKIDLLNAIESRLKKSEGLKQSFSKNIQGLDYFLLNAKKFDDLKKLSEEKELRNYKKKSIVYSEGNYSKGVYFINKGKVKTYKSNEEGKEFITGLYKEGDFFGYLTLLEEKEYNDSAMTLEDSELFLLPKEDFFSLVYKNAEVSRKFISILTDNLKEKELQLIKLAYNSVRKRVAESLATLADRFKKEGDSLFVLNISRDDLSNISGTAKESAIRTLSEFKDEGLIDISGGTITILNLEKLKKLKN
jgi:CheY-like chemotaxis protein/CRP-like cAMP-binding protein